MFLKTLRFKVVYPPISEFTLCRYFDYKLIQVNFCHMALPPPHSSRTKCVMCIVINFHGSYVLIKSNLLFYIDLVLDLTNKGEWG